MNDELKIIYSEVDYKRDEQKVFESTTTMVDGYDKLLG